MNIFKKLFGKSSKDASRDEDNNIVKVVPNFVANENLDVDDVILLDMTLGLKQIQLLDMLVKTDGSNKKEHIQEQNKIAGEIIEASKQCTSPDALNVLAALYINGWGVAQDVSKGIELLHEAASKDCVAAMDNLGNYYNTTLGGNDLDSAMQWWQKAAELGFAPSQATLGRLLKERGDYAQAMKWAKKGASQGNADAEYLMGTFYTHGYGVKADYNEAFKWYRLAAEKGHARAQCDVAVCYANGEGVEKDEQQMAYWYEKSAEQGDPTGLRGLYLCYMNGTGVPQDQNKALGYLQQAAQSGIDLIQHELGNHYMSMGDYKNAMAWFTQAANQGFARSQNEIGLLYKNGEGVAKNPKQAIFWFEKAALQGHTDAMNNLASVLYQSKNDLQNAIYWFNRAAEAGNVIAISNLAEFYMAGKGVEQNIMKGMSLLQKAAYMGDEYSANLLDEYNERLGGDFRSAFLAAAISEGELWFPTSSIIFPDNIDNQEILLKQCKKGDAISQVFVGESYIRGERNFEQNYDEGVKWLKKAAASQDPYGQNSLANIYLLQNEQDDAIKLYRKAAHKNNDSALYNLAMCYALGLGVEADINEALDWLNKAAEYGSRSAHIALNLLNGDELEQ